MKQIKKLFILLLLCVPCFVKADMGAPMLREFEIVVVNPDGVDYEANDYNEEATGHLDKDSVVLVTDDFNNQYTIGVKESDGTTSILGKVNSLDGFSIVQEEVDPSKTDNDSSIKKFDTKQKALVYSEKGVNIYKGPSKIYKYVGTIKKGVKLDYQYAIDGEGGITYIYVDYKGQKGWVEILNKNVLIENEVQFIFRVDVDSECGIIPKNTIVKPEYKTDRWSGSALFENKKCKTLLKTFKSEEIMTLYNLKAKSKVEIPIYDDTDKSNLIMTIPSNADLIYYTGSDSQMGTIDIHYVEYNGKRGWAFVTYDDFEIEYGDKVEYAKIDLAEKKEVKKEESKKEEKKDDKKLFGLNKNEFVLVCVAGGVILSLTGLIIIILINKKKKNKKVEKIEKQKEFESKEEEQQETESKEEE